MPPLYEKDPRAVIYDALSSKELDKKSLYDEVNALLSSWNPLEVPDYVAETEYESYVYMILDILKSGKDLESYIYNDIFEGAMGLGPSELAESEISTLCRSIEKVYKNH